MNVFFVVIALLLTDSLMASNTDLCSGDEDSSFSDNSFCDIAVEWDLVDGYEAMKQLYNDAFGDEGESFFLEDITYPLGGMERITAALADKRYETKVDALEKLREVYKPN